MGTDGWADVRRAAQAALDDLDTVVARCTVAIRERVPEYAYVPDEQLNVAVHRNIGTLIKAIAERRTLATGELGDFERTVEDRARNGVPLDEYLLAVTTAEASMWDQLWEGTETSRQSRSWKPSPCATPMSPLSPGSRPPRTGASS